MTLDEARLLAKLLSDDINDWPCVSQSLCTCISCLKDYAERLSLAFPQFVWGEAPDKDVDGDGFGKLVVRERDDTTS